MGRYTIHIVHIIIIIIGTWLTFADCQAYVYEEGLVRFASEDFSMEPEKLKEPCVHLTNNEAGAAILDASRTL